MHVCFVEESKTFGVSPMDKYNQALLDNVHPLEWKPPKPPKRYNMISIGAGAGGIVSAAGCAGLGPVKTHISLLFNLFAKNNKQNAQGAKQPLSKSCSLEGIV